jgi:hypothetical protein
MEEARREEEGGTKGGGMEEARREKEGRHEGRRNGGSTKGGGMEEARRGEDSTNVKKQLSVPQVNTKTHNSKVRRVRRVKFSN